MSVFSPILINCCQFFQIFLMTIKSIQLLCKIALTRILLAASRNLRVCSLFADNRLQLRRSPKRSERTGLTQSQTASLSFLTSYNFLAFLYFAPSFLTQPNLPKISVRYPPDLPKDWIMSIFSLRLGILIFFILDNPKAP